MESYGFHVEQVLEHANGLFVICRNPPEANGYSNGHIEPAANGEHKGNYSYTSNGGPEDAVGSYYSSEDAFK